MTDKPARGQALVALSAVQLPALFTLTPDAGKRFIEFFTANIRNPNTRKAYARATAEFAAWCQTNGLNELRLVEPFHVAAYIEGLQLAAPSIKQRLAALRVLFNWLVVGQGIPSNPAAAVSGPKHSVKKGKTPVLTAEEARTLLDSIDISTPMGRRDRALTALTLMVYTFARVGAALKMKVEDVYTQGRRTWVRLHEKGGKQHEMPCHHNLDNYLHQFITKSGLDVEPKSLLFRTAMPHTGQLTDRPMSQADAYRMIGRRALAAGIATKIGNHSFRATGITEYLKNGGKLEVAQAMANHESARTTGLYDRRSDQINLDEVERIVI